MVEISERETELPDAIIGKLLKIASEDKSIVSLGPGEPDFKLPKPIVSFVKKYADDCNHYSPPGGRIELKEQIIKKLKKDNKIKELLHISHLNRPAQLLIQTSYLKLKPSNRM